MPTRPDPPNIKSFCQALLEEFRGLFLLESSLLFVRAPGAQSFQLEAAQDPGALLISQDRKILELVACLDQPSVIVDTQRALFLAELIWPGGLRVVLAGRRGLDLRPFRGQEETEALRQFVATERKVPHLPAPPPKPKPVMASLPRLVAGRYARGLKILEGRFSTLYSAFDQQTMAPVLLRRLDGPGASESDEPCTLGRQARQQLLREGRFMSRLEHENLPRYVETVDDGGQLYLVHEAVSGTTLDKKQRERLQNDALFGYFKQFTDILGYLHHQSPPLIHRDLRPDNILVTVQGTLKLLEFSLARMKDNQHDPRPTHFRGLGDPVYAAPEQLLGHPSAPSQDLYAVGSILYFLATGHPPARSTDRWEGTSIETALGELRPDLNSMLVHCIEWMRQPVVGLRPKSIYDVEVHLDQCC